MRLWIGTNSWPRRHFLPREGMAGRKPGQKTRRQSFSCLNLKTLLSTNNRNIYQIFIYLMSLNSGKCTRKWRGSKYQCEYLGSSEPMFWWTWIFHKLNLLLQIAFGHVWVATLHNSEKHRKKDPQGSVGSGLCSPPHRKTLCLWLAASQHFWPLSFHFSHIRTSTQTVLHLKCSILTYSD